MPRLDVTKSSFHLDSFRGRTLGRFTPLAVAVAVALGFTWAGVSSADDTGCVLGGEPVMPPGTAIYDAPIGGNELGHFTGARVALSVSSFPENASGRAAVETSGFRLKGFVRARDLPVYTAHSLPIYAGHLWIAEARRVSVIGAAAGRLRVERSVTSPMVGIFQAVPCNALTLTEKVPPGWTPSGSERGYVLKHDHVELFSEAKGDTVTAIDRASDGPGVLFWSDDRSGGWVHVEHHSDVVIDAWARAQDLSPLPPGETMDQLASSILQSGAPNLKVQGNTKVVHTATPVLLRATGGDAAAVIGGIDGGVDVLVLDVVAGWASVVPKGLGVAPSGAAQFWASAKDLGL